MDYCQGHSLMLQPQWRIPVTDAPPLPFQAFSGEGLKIVERLRLTQEGLELEHQVIPLVQKRL